MSIASPSIGMSLTLEGSTDEADRQDTVSESERERSELQAQIIAKVGADLSHVKTLDVHGIGHISSPEHCAEQIRSMTLSELTAIRDLIVHNKRAPRPASATEVTK